MDTPCLVQCGAAAGESTAGKRLEPTGTDFAVRCSSNAFCCQCAAHWYSSWYHSCVCCPKLRQICTCVHQSSACKRSTNGSDECESCSWWTQYWWLLKRSLLAQLRNPTDVTSRLLLSCWIGLLAGALCAHWKVAPPVNYPVHSFTGAWIWQWRYVSVVPGLSRAN